MNPLGNGNIGSLPVGLKQNIQQIKMMMNNPAAILQQNPMISQIMQTYKGQDLKSVFYNLAQQKGVNPDAILNELQK